MNWTDEFDREGPTLLEIGFGNGQFLLDLAIKRPEANILGIEISSPSIRNARRLLENSGIKNARLIRSAAQLAIWTLFDVCSIQGVYINYPDPWPKAKHHKRRIVNDHALRLLATRMANGASLEIATDHDDYCLWIADHLERSPFFSSRISTPFTMADTDRKQTKYELKALEENVSSCYFKWQRNHIDAPNDFQFPEEIPMPHILLISKLTVSEISERIELFELFEGDVGVQLIGLYKSVHSEVVLCDTFITEQPYNQRIMLRLSQRQTGELILQLHKSGHPRPTAGTQIAIRSIAKAIAALDPEMRIIRHNLGVWPTTTSG